MEGGTMLLSLGVGALATFGYHIRAQVGPFSVPTGVLASKLLLTGQRTGARLRAASARHSPAAAFQTKEMEQTINTDRSPFSSSRAETNGPATTGF